MNSLASRLPNLTLDRQALELVALYTVVLGITAALAAWFGPEQAATISPPEQFGDGATGEAGAAAAATVLEVAFAGTMLALILVYNRLPEWAQELTRTDLFMAAMIYIGARYGPEYGTAEVLVLAVGVYTGYKLLDRAGLYWLVNNLFSVTIAVIYGVVLGMLFGVPGMGLLLLGLTLYDHVFANQRDWMFTMGKTLVSIGLPVLFLRPTDLRNEWGDIVDMFDDGSEDEDESDGKPEDTASWGLGTADLMLPAGFVAAVVTTPTSAVLVGGVVAGVVCIAGALVACLRLRFEMLTRGSGAGLPALSGGLLVAYAAVSAAGLLGLA